MAISVELSNSIMDYTAILLWFVYTCTSVPTQSNVALIYNITLICTPVPTGTQYMWLQRLHTQKGRTKHTYCVRRANGRPIHVYRWIHQLCTGSHGSEDAMAGLGTLRHTMLAEMNLYLWPQCTLIRWRSTAHHLQCSVYTCTRVHSVVYTPVHGYTLACTHMASVRLWECFWMDSPHLSLLYTTSCWIFYLM